MPGGLIGNTLEGGIDEMMVKALLGDLMRMMVEPSA